MKKYIAMLLVCCMFTISTVPIVGANEHSSENNQCPSCQIDEDDLANVIYQNAVYDESGALISFTAVVPLKPGEIPPPEGRSIVGALVTIISSAYTACSYTFYSTGGFNPCTYLAGMLGRKIVNGIIKWLPKDNGNWEVIRHQHYGKIPNCEPSHSAGCVGWYYTYSYERLS